jgi:hypothetical protein
MKEERKDKRKEGRTKGRKEGRKGGWSKLRKEFASRPSTEKGQEK